MISSLKYKLYEGRAYLSDATEGSSPTLTVSIDDVEDGWLTVDGGNYKISHGSASVPINRLKDGVHPMSINTERGRVELGRISVAYGAISLYTDASTLAKIEGELYSLTDILMFIAATVVRLEDAVFGTKLFEIKEKK